jgi:hypothetical protein
MAHPNTGTTRTGRVVPNKRNFTMKTTKTLMLAAVTALTLGVGAAMAQSEVPSMPSDASHFSGQRQAAPKIINDGSGASDVDTLRGGVSAHFDYGTLANPG